MQSIKISLPTVSNLLASPRILRLLIGVGVVVKVMAVVQLPGALSDDTLKLRSARLRGGVLHRDVPGGCCGGVGGEAAHLRSRAIGRGV